MCEVSAFAVAACDANVCDTTECDTTECDTTEGDVTVGGEADYPVTQTPSLALTRCETSPMSARP